MTPNLTSTLSCAVFGHNFERSKSKSEFICTACKIKVDIDQNGDFEELPSQNKEVHQTIRQLFLLSRRKTA
ncbi:hypothetical protein [Winogradskyella sp. 3972H.M.0a.05]|uniref:hypothetical protein n=1 Tax=Winogradskyella sp. 3972H.M.0a.05 TaxID=2950277 RepID=UPI003398B16C